MRHRAMHARVILVLATFLFASQAMAAPKYESFTLKNGLEVIVVPNTRVPAISHTLWFRAGAADDTHGKSGIAHFLEHMMFRGTKTHKAGEFSKTITALGGEHNAFTGRDMAAYYVNIAKEHLPLVMELEADRMQHLAPDEKDFEREKQVILEERRARTDNNPTALIDEQMDAALFLNHPYRLPVIGWAHEIEQITLKDVMDFYHAYYHPGNAILIVAGDITAAELKPLAEKYYGAIPDKLAPARHWTSEPPQRAPRQLAMTHVNAREPLWMRAYIAPSLHEGETAHALPLFVLAQALGGGPTSTLYQSLVVDQKLATDVDADYNGIAYGPGIFSISATPAPGVASDKLETAIDALLTDVLTKPLANEDIRRAKILLKAEVIYALDGLESAARMIGQLRMTGLKTNFLDTWDHRVDAVKAADLLSAAQAVLVDERSVTALLLPKTEAADAKAP